MKNLSLNSKQNAAIKQTLSIEEFIKKYISSSNVEIQRFKIFLLQFKKGIKK